MKTRVERGSLFAIGPPQAVDGGRGPHGRELYRTDGTDVLRLTDIDPGILAPNILDGDYAPIGDSLYRDVPLTVLDGELYFPAFGAGRNVDLYRFTPVPEPSAGILLVLAAAFVTLWITRTRGDRTMQHVRDLKSRSRANSMWGTTCE